MSILKRMAGALAIATLLTATSLQAQTVSDTALLKALQRGGNVIVMRHASSPRTLLPDAASAARGNISLERQLDETGHNTATAMGKALRDLKIHVGMVLSSKTFRALETALYMEVTEPKAYKELSDNGASMQRMDPQQGAWIRELAQHSPAGSSNLLIITHQPNLEAAFPQYAGKMADGEALILSKDAKGNVIALGRIKIEDWPKLGKAQ